MRPETERTGPREEAGPTTITSASVTDQPYQLLPPLTADEYAALRADIEANGIRVPVDVDENGEILDGHHRQRIAADLGIPCPTRVVAGLTEEEKRHHAVAVNAHRRMLTRDQRRGLVAAELDRDPSRSDRAIGRVVGVSHHTVAAIRRGGWAIAQDADDPPPATQAEAEQMIRDIRIDLLTFDLRCMWALVQGLKPAELVRYVVQRCGGEGLPAEARDDWWQHVVQPRIDGAYAWPDGGFYRMRALDSITWPEWPDYDAGLAAGAERMLHEEFPQSAPSATGQR